MAASGPHEADIPTVLPGSHSRLPCLPTCTSACAPNDDRSHRYAAR
jgi:hypothetical protein